MLFFTPKSHMTLFEEIEKEEGFGDGVRSERVIRHCVVLITTERAGF